MITEADTVSILVVTLALMAVTILAVNLLIRRRIGHRVVESEIYTGKEWFLGTLT